MLQVKNHLRKTNQELRVSYNFVGKNRCVVDREYKRVSEIMSVKVSIAQDSNMGYNFRLI